MMVWWLFKKRDDEFKWIKLNDSLTNSFQKIKEEIKQAHKIIENKHTNHSTIIKDLDRRVTRLERKVLSAINQTTEKSYIIHEESKTKENKVDKTFIDNLTPLHKKILSYTFRIGQETGHKWITMKKISEDCRPGRKYSDIKSTISTYTDNLVELNLIYKKRKGRNIYLSLTDKAIALLPEIEQQLDFENDMEIN